MSTEETITSLIKGVPDWHDTINSNFQTVANAIDDNINKIGDLNTSLSGVTNRFQTKKYVAMGDSITVGFVDKPYATLVGEQCNLQVVNLGISGSSMGENGTSPSPVCDRLNTLPCDASIISIAVGTNDFGYNTPIGMSGDTSNTTFYGATRNVCEYLQANFTNAQVFFITPLHRATEETENAQGCVLEDYVNVIRDICNMYSIPVLDLYADASFNIRTQTTNFSADGLHPIQPGHDLMAQKISRFINSL